MKDATGVRNSGHLTLKETHPTPKGTPLTLKSGQFTPKSSHLTLKATHLTPKVAPATLKSSHLTRKAGHLTRTRCRSGLSHLTRTW